MFGSKDEEKRFVVIKEQREGFIDINIMVDTETGVNYLLILGSGQSELTPLLDGEGKVIVDKELID